MILMHPTHTALARRLAVASAVTIGTFAVYYSTLLPGFDFGDTGSFQATVGSASISPRDGYPLYFAIGDAFLWLTRTEPARALNLASAVEASVACGLLALVAAELSSSLFAGAGAALLFAASYTYWSQAIIAEVYALHIAFVAATLLVLLRWQARPTTKRLAAFFALYALGFGNHLSMILLAPAYTVFLLLSAPGGWRSMLRPRVLGLALTFAALGACQYLWNLRDLWYTPHPPHGLLDALQRFWFDVTKSDWRETMVLNVPESMWTDRAAMYAFDLRQQFGSAVPFVALFGLATLLWIDIRRGVLLVLLYGATTMFAYGYNVGDAHVFFLPSHAYVALMTAAAIGGGARLSRRRSVLPAASAALFVYAAIRLYADYPALDRSGDRRPTAVMTALTDGIDDRHTILFADVNWQLQNGLSYFAKEVRRDVAYTRAAPVLLYAPVLIHDNEAIGRSALATEGSRRLLSAAYGPLLPSAIDRTLNGGGLARLVDGLAPGTRYVIAVLKPVREFPLDRGDLASALRSLTSGTVEALPPGDYAAIAGTVGAPPALAEGADRPFRQSLQLGGTPVTIRMDSWLAADTIRRMGFGHVIAARRHTLILERGVSFAAFDRDGRTIRSGYAAGIFAPLARYFVRTAGLAGE